MFKAGSKRALQFVAMVDHIIEENGQFVELPTCDTDEDGPHEAHFEPDVELVEIFRER